MLNCGERNVAECHPPDDDVLKHTGIERNTRKRISKGHSYTLGLFFDRREWPFFTNPVDIAEVGNGVFCRTAGKGSRGTWVGTSNC
jgi:hypothetical protein